MAGFRDTASNLLLQGLDGRGFVDINVELRKTEKKSKVRKFYTIGLSCLTVKAQQQKLRQIQISRL